jgi:hypothetical protein
MTAKWFPKPPVNLKIITIAAYDMHPLRRKPTSERHGNLNENSERLSVQLKNW